MKLTVLGNRGPLPLPGEACSSYLLESDGHFLMIDAGSASLPHLLQQAQLAQVDALILSHLHFDHCSDALVMQYSLKNQPMRLICPAEPGSVKEALLSFGGFVWEEAKQGETVSVGPFCVKFGPARHPVPCVSVRVECEGRVFAYTGDSNTCPEQVQALQGADLLLADAGMLPSVWTEASPHRTPEMCGELAAACKTARLMLTHFGPAQDPKTSCREAAAAFSGEILAARVDEQIRI